MGAQKRPDRRSARALLALGLLGLIVVVADSESTKLPRLDPASDALPISANAPPTVGSGLERAPKPFVSRRLGRSPDDLQVVDGELLVRVRPGTPGGRVESLALGLGSRVLGYGSYSGLYRLALPAGSSHEDFLARLQVLPEVREARPHPVAVGAGDCPSGTYRGIQWNLDMIEASAACARAIDRSDVVVAVLDSGLALSTVAGQLEPRVDDLAGTVILPGYDFVNQDGLPDDDNQHGTHIAGTIAGAHRAIGVAPGVRLLPVKVLDHTRRGTELQVVEGIYYAVDHGADVINLSLSFGHGYFPSAALQDAVSYAVGHGVVLVASAGNAGRWGVSYPASFPDVIAVGASRLAKGLDGATIEFRAHYSNAGYRLDLMAPGGVPVADVDRNGYPDAILAQTISPDDPSQVGYWFMSGTSQSAAHVSGAVAWLLAAGASPDQVKPTLTVSAAAIRRADYDPRIGAGSLRLNAALDLSLSGVAVDLPRYYVNLLPWLHRTSTGGTRAVVRIEVIDADGMPAAGVKVGGSWFGSVTTGNESGMTDATGVAYVASPEVFSAAGVVVGFQAESVAVPGIRAASAPTQIYGLSPASAELYARMLSNEVDRESMVLFRIDSADPALIPLIPSDDVIPAFVATPLGPGLRSGPLAIVLDDRFAPELSDPVPATVTAREWTWSVPLSSGRGLVTSIQGIRIDAVVPRLGAASRYTLLPFDPAMAHFDLEHAYPVLNSPEATFLSDNIAFGNGFASSSLGDGFASSSLGDGFASSSLGDGFASSSLGDGFASSSLGDGFASSSLGDGFASSSLGNGFASSSLGSGFASSSLGDSDGDGIYASESAAVGGEDGADGSDSDGGAGGDPGSVPEATLSLSTVDPELLLTDEEALAAVTNEVPYPPIE